MNATLEKKIAEEVVDIDIEFNFLEKDNNSTPVTVNLSETSPRGSRLASVPLEVINQVDITKEGGWINYVPMGVSLTLLSYNIVPWFLKSKTSHVQQ